MNTKIGYRAIALLIGSILCVSSTFAGGVSPYVPLTVAPEIERQIERLMVLADVPQLVRPFRVSQVFDAYEKVCADQRASTICKDVSKYLERFHYGFGVTQLSELPDAARNYMDYIERKLGVPIHIVSTGPDRAETITLRHPFDA